MKTDSELRELIKEEILWEPGVSTPEIGVIVEDSIVTLTGCVDTLPEKWATEKAALRVPDVKAIANNLEVKSSTGSQHSDEDIARAASNALKWDIILPHNLQVVVEDSWVTLTGTVQLQFQKNAAENMVKHVPGVTGVTNNITVKSRVAPEDVRGEIETGLQNYASHEAKGIQVTAKDGKVTLEGTVHSWEEREAAGMAAWAAPGVMEVENNLSIE